MNKQLMWFLVFVGGAIGGYIPTLWGDSEFSFTSILFSAIGSFAGIYVAYRLSVD